RQLVHARLDAGRLVDGLGVAPGTESYRRHLGSTRNASLSHWTMRPPSRPAIQLYQTACRHPVARRSMTMAWSDAMTKYGPSLSTTTPFACPATLATAVFSG